MNEIIKEIKFKVPSAIKVKILNDTDGVELFLKQDVIKLEAKHNQDCCERVYADFGILSYYLTENNYLPSLCKRYAEIYTKLIIKKVKEIGILLIFFKNKYYQQKILIPCYNEQNGYYSNELTLKITHNEKEEEINIVDCEQLKLFD